MHDISSVENEMSKRASEWTYLCGIQTDKIMFLPIAYELYGWKGLVAHKVTHKDDDDDYGKRNRV